MEVMIGEIIKVMKIMIAIMHYTVNTMIVKKMRNLVLMSINLCNIQSHVNNDINICEVENNEIEDDFTTHFDNVKL